MHERIRRVLLDRLARLATTRPRLTLAVSITLAVLCVAATWRWLTFLPDRSDLVDADLAWNQRYAQHKEHFPRWNDLIIAIAGNPDDAQIDDLARTIAERLQVDGRVAAADAGYNAADAGPRLFRIAPTGEYRAALGELRELHTLVESAPTATASLTAMIGRLRARQEAAPTDDSQLQQLQQIIQPYLAGLRGDDVSFDVLQIDRDQWVPFKTRSGRIRFVRVHFATHTGTVDTVGDNVRWLREQVRYAVGMSNRPSVEWGVTGIPAIEADETTQSIRDSTIASILAFVLITTLMVVVFRGIAVPLIAASTLLIGIAWSFGWLMLSVGHLQLLSVVFTVILLGIGVDFSVHLIARLELLRDAFDTLPAAMGRVFQGMGPGLVTGALTTAAAFGVTALTKFRGMAEMGIIAAGGIVLCLIATFFVLPALLGALNWKRVIRHRRGGEEAHFAHGRLDVIDRRPVLVLIIAAVVVAIMAWPASRARYDPNVLKLHPPGIESVAWEKRIVEDDNSSAWAGLVHTDAVHAPDLADSFRELPEVAGVGAMGRLFPADRARREREIAALRDLDLAVVEAGNSPELLLSRLQQIRFGLQAAMTGDDADPLGQRIVDDITAAITDWQAADEATQLRRFSRIEQAYNEARDALRQFLAAALSPGPLGPDDLPAVLRELWMGSDGRWLLEVEPADDPQNRPVLHPDRLGPFVAAMRTVDSNVLGPPVQIYESSELIKREYLRSAVYALLAVMLILLIDFQSMADVISAILPVAVGFLGAFAMLGALGMPLNFANIIVMPLIFGIGVDAGVHMVHRWRVEPLGRPAGLSGATGRGITLTMVTTMIGFGCMLTAEHRGIRSLGAVMVTGLAVTLAACYFILPAVLRLRTRRELSETPRDREPYPKHQDGGSERG